ncbi:MAG: hypothetical protein LDL41_13970 [Coleofasciculus sp. S288]|nr:hypothetical protein [Coleofasciculus sp. S288]
MELTLLNQLGEWNPQLFRELKGQLKLRNLVFTVAGSLVSQLLILLVFSQQNCLDSACTQIDWEFRWPEIFRTMNWLLPFILIFGGTYLLISNLGKEEHRGTLNFIRLSPQSSQSILLGKLLGVPALLYLGIALAVPLHWVSALADSVSFVWLLGIYSLWGAGCYLFYTTALLIALLNRFQGAVQTQAWAGGVLAALLGLIYTSVIDVSFNSYRASFGLGDWHWFFLPLGRQAGLIYVWTLITLSVGSHWIWQATNRLFRNPKATLLSKRQSYWLVGSLQVWLLGFVLPQPNSVVSDSQLFLSCSILFVFNPIAFLILTTALSPHRQNLQDWSRYRHKNRSPGKGVLNHSLVQDLIWGEKSPALVAIAINFLLTAAIWVPWILLVPHEVWQEENIKLHQALLGLLLTLNLILIYAAIVELMVFMSKSKQLMWLLVIVGGGIVLPLVIGLNLGIEPINMPFIWLFSPLPILTLVNASIPTVLLGVLAQLGVLSLLTLQLTRQLQKAGESTTKMLFASQK